LLERIFGFRKHISWETITLLAFSPIISFEHLGFFFFHRVKRKEGMPVACASTGTPPPGAKKIRRAPDGLMADGQGAASIPWAGRAYPRGLLTATWSDV